MNEPSNADTNSDAPPPGQDAQGSVAEPTPAAAAGPRPNDGGYGLAEPATPASPGPTANPNGDWSVDQTAPSTFEPKPVEGEEASIATDYPAETPIVEKVWTRWSEWKEPAIWSAGGVVAAILIWLGGAYISVLTLLIALAYGSYHLVITLEIPVRVTPEQAVREFFGSLNHRLPNYARMYSLLTAEGRESDAFAEFSGFRAYWHSQLARLVRSPVWMVPLEFGIDGFKCRYNAERVMAAVRYKLRVTPRGSQASDDPIAEFDVQNLAVKGPDGQWYLNIGLFPDPTENNDD